MATSSFNKTLLALLLALKDLEASLSEREQTAFRNAADRLQLDPDNWTDYESDLLIVLQANPTLNQLYQVTKSQLDAFCGDPSLLLPTQAELEQAIPTRQTSQTRGFIPVIDDYESDEINNIVINVLATPNPIKTTKKLSYLEKIQKLLRQSPIEQK